MGRMKELSTDNIDTHLVVERKLWVAFVCFCNSNLEIFEFSNQKPSEMLDVLVGTWKRFKRNHPEAVDHCNNIFKGAR